MQPYIMSEIKYYIPGPAHLHMMCTDQTQHSADFSCFHVFEGQGRVETTRHERPSLDNQLSYICM